MAATISTFSTVEEIRNFIEHGLSYEEISSELELRYPGITGFSTRSIRRFCKENNINKNCTLPKSEKEELIRRSVLQVSYFNLVHNFVWDS